MSTKRKSEFIQCRYFGWLLWKRNNVWHADGRSNDIKAGRHSLGTRDEDEARQLIHELDETLAMKLGKIERKAPAIRSGLTIVDAIDKFREHKGRPISVGGVEPETLARYDRILNKFVRFSARRHIIFATEIDQEMFDEYVSMLEEMDFAPSTIVTEMVLLKSLHSFCIEKKLLDGRFDFKYPLTRTTESLTYCPTDAEVAEILRLCKSNSSLGWLHLAVSVLSQTGLRFGEARDLEWRDIDKDFKLLHVRDESFLKKSTGDNTRKTKSRRSRKIPIHKDLAVLLKALPSRSGKILAGPRGGGLRNDLFGDSLRDRVLPDVIDAVGGDDVRRLTAHGFRHYFVSRCANAGIPQLSVMSWLGHRTARMTNYYYHSNEAASLRHMRLLEAEENSDRCDHNH